VTILLTHADEERRIYYADDVLARLRALGEVRLNLSGQPLAGDAFTAAAAGCEIIVGDTKAVADAKVLAGLPSLIAYVHGHVDLRRIDVAAASANGILVTHAGAHFAAPVAELVLAFMIDLSRGITRATNLWRAGTPPRTALSTQLARHTVGIIGYGVIGRHLAGLARAIGMRVLVADPYVSSIAEQGIELVSKADLLAQSEYVVPLAPATPETRNLIDAAALAHMKPTAFLINVSRGELVDEAALEDALDRKAIAGAALDVGLAPFQMPPDRLASRPDVIATPHIGGVTPESLHLQASDTVDQVAEILSGRIPRGAVNADRATRLTKLSQR
jgi:D-3-phosphoglycerate dehydrogenase